MDLSPFHYVFILIIFELYEAWWQKEQTLGGMLVRIAQAFDANIFLFFLRHPGFYWVLFVIVTTGLFNIAMGILIVLKAADILVKMAMVNKLREQAVSDAFLFMLRQPLPSWMPWLGTLIYPALLAVGLLLR